MRLFGRTLLLIALASTLHAQGTLMFANRLSSNTWARVFDCDDVPLAGTNFSAQLFAGPPGRMEAQLSPVDQPLPFRTGAIAGAWAGRLVTIPSIAPGETAMLQVRVWDNRGGTLKTEAAAATGGAFRLRSRLFTSLPLGGSDPPTLPPRIVGNPDPANNLRSFDCIGDLPPIRLAGLPVVADGRLQIDFEVALAEADRAFVLLKANSAEGVWFRDPVATLQRLGTNQACWKFRLQATVDDRSPSFYRLVSR